MIVAVIVTYNRCEKLKKSIKSILNGAVVPDKIVVVNNNSTDETLNYLNELIVDTKQFFIVNTIKNIGGAGGFTLGIKVAYDLGADYIWIADDDAYVDKDCLQQLIVARNKILANSLDFSFLCSRVIWKDGEACKLNEPVPTVNWMKSLHIDPNLINVYSCSFVSLLVCRKFIDTVGLPILEFFIWYDDVEFSSRLGQCAPGYMVIDSLVTHDVVENNGADYIFMNAENIWKYKYGARNHAWTIIKREGLFRMFKFSLGIFKDRRLQRIPFKYKVAIFFASISSIGKKWRPLFPHEINLNLFVKDL